ncbi:TPA: hypothetical protein QCY24_003379 [Bacillus wiedmannii]|uniref:hypothetical protein n=1 Tax=Bacillus wiedmannii TaxID=1890302 RepID=UPI0024065DFA|nr:hypothetical protein [Bacillus wiedmannii]MDF9663913.1 hypothetical protein [Bacillus wiedmannii]HDR7658986.1 hypothetical protein [Bacillus wiedmannii]HDR7869678.1 hypothetical protein [Bacillus wiedmannii]HDR7961633.1 hypothetical protein [Bacillus wiedmannii]
MIVQNINAIVIVGNTNIMMIVQSINIIVIVGNTNIMMIVQSIDIIVIVGNTNIMMIVQSIDTIAIVGSINIIVIENIGKIIYDFLLPMRNSIKRLILCKKGRVFLFVINNDNYVNKLSIWAAYCIFLLSVDYFAKCWRYP